MGRRTTKFKPKYAAFFNSYVHNFRLYLFEKFISLLEVVQETTDFQEEFSRPLPAFLKVFDAVPDTPDAGVEREIFSSWIEPYSWSMLLPSTMHAQVTWSDPANFMNRLLRRSLPKLTVVAYIRPVDDVESCGLRAGHIVSIWTPERSDIRANVFEALAPAEAREGTLKELRSLDHQLFWLNAHLALLQELVTLVRKTRRASAPADNSHHWFTKWCERWEDCPLQRRNITQLTRADWLIDEQDYVPGKAPSFAPPGYEGINPHKMSEIATQRRKDVKARWKTLELLKDAARLLIRYKSNASRSSLAALPYVRSELTCGKEAKDARAIRRELSALGL